MKIKFKKSALTALTGLAIQVPFAFAGTMGPAVIEPTWVGSLSVGPVWHRAGETQNIFLTPEIEKTYAAYRTSKAIADGEFFFGMQKPLGYQFLGQLGLAFATTDFANLQGEIWDDADPQFNNYTYSYQVRHSHVAVKGKLLADRGYAVLPWISGSLGVGFNQARGFDNVPTIFEAVKNPNFTSHTRTAFTYTLGAGIQKAITTNWQVGVGYEFADWGKSSLGRAAEQTLNNGPELNHLYTNGVMFNITWLA